MDRAFTYPGGGGVPVALAQDLDGEAPGNAEHGPAGVDELGLAEAGEVGGGGAEGEGVETVVSKKQQKNNSSSVANRDLTIESF